MPASKRTFTCQSSFINGVQLQGSESHTQDDALQKLPKNYTSTFTSTTTGGYQAEISGILK